MSAWTKEREAEAIARCEAATPGPWFFADRRANNGEEIQVVVSLPPDADPDDPDDPEDDGFLIDVLFGNHDQCQENWDFAVESRTDLPDAIAEIRRLREVLDGQDHAETCNKRRCRCFGDLAGSDLACEACSCDCFKSHAVPPSTT